MNRTQRYANIPLERISPYHPDPAIARTMNWQHVYRIRDEYNPDAFGTPTVCESDGSDGFDFWPVCGQHRLEAARKLGLVHVYCQVVGSDPRTVARVFIDEGRSRRQHPLKMWQLRLVAGDGAALEIERIVTSYGFRIPANPTQARYVLTSLKPVELAHAHGLLDACLEVIRDAFGGDWDACQGWFLSGLLMVLMNCQRENFRVDLHGLKRDLTKEGITNIQNAYRHERKCNTGLSREMCGRIIVRVYNKRRIHRMPWIVVEAPEGDGEEGA